MKRFLISVISIVLLVVVAGAVIMWRVRERPAPYSASYLFNEVNFVQIVAGMAASEVRDLIGPPLSHERWQSEGNSVRWVYSSMRTSGPQYGYFSVTFDESTQRVLRTRRHNRQVAKDPKTDAYPLIGPRPPARPWRIRKFDFPMIQGEAPALDGQKCYLIQVMASWCAPCTKQRPYVVQMLDDVELDSPIDLLLVSVDEERKAIEQYIHEHKITAPVAWDPQNTLAANLTQTVIPKYLVLKDGIISPFDIPHYHGWTDEFFADLKWFIGFSGIEEFASNGAKE